LFLIDRISGYNDTNFLGESSNWDGARIYQMNQNNTFTKKQMDGLLMELK